MSEHRTQLLPSACTNYIPQQHQPKPVVKIARGLCDVCAAGNHRRNHSEIGCLNHVRHGFVCDCEVPGTCFGRRAVAS